jgi:riboflavin synthase
MFTGIVEDIGIVELMRLGVVTQLGVRSERVAKKVSVGDSVCVSGVCLTVTSVDGARITFDAVPETLRRSTLRDLKPGDEVNLETSLRADGVIGGHFVFGHVDGIGRICSVRQVSDSAELGIQAPDNIIKYVVEKGSIAVDGVSLTIASVRESEFSVAVIPHTLAVTTLGKKKVGDHVNLEVDVIAKYVEKFLRYREANPGVTEDFLRQTGFL